jgi:hypothetical protein
MKADPEETPVDHWPLWRTRPVMSALPSPLKSPTSTSTHMTFGFQVTQKALEKAEPLDTPTHQCPLCKTRPAMSILPSPLKSPTMTSAQVTMGFHVVHRLLAKEEPVEGAIHHWPDCSTRPTWTFAPQTNRIRLVLGPSCSWKELRKVVSRRRTHTPPKNKFEIRNSKQTQNPKHETWLRLGFGASSLFRISCFGFRILERWPAARVRQVARGHVADSLLVASYSEGPACG